MKRTLGILICCFGFSGTTLASDQSDVLAVVHSWVKAFNAGDPKSAAALCTDDAVVIDVLAPYRWTAPGACGAWVEAFGAWIKENEAVLGKTRLGKVRYVEVTGQHAYLDVAASFTMTVKGKPASGRGTWTFAMRKSGGHWQIEGWSWAQQ